MANLATYLQTVFDFINRNAPFDGNPLIQKSEDLEVRELLANSVIFKEPTTTSISSPGAAFSCDFAATDEFNIDTSGSVGSTFAVTLAGLENNRVGRLNITKKSADVFSFVNGTILPFDLNIQVGVTSISFIVVKIGSLYYATLEKQVSLLGAWQDLTLLTGWSVSGGRTPRIRKSADLKRVEFQGTVLKGATGDINFADIVSGYSPSFGSLTSLELPIIERSINVATVFIANSVIGKFSILNASNGESYDLDGIFYYQDTF